MVDSKRSLSLREIVSQQTHTQVGNIQFDCPLIQYSPPATHQYGEH